MNTGKATRSRDSRKGLQSQKLKSVTSTGEPETVYCLLEAEGSHMLRFPVYSQFYTSTHSTESTAVVVVPLCEGDMQPRKNFRRRGARLCARSTGIAGLQWVRDGWNFWRVGWRTVIAVSASTTTANEGHDARMVDHTNVKRAGES